MKCPTCKAWTKVLRTKGALRRRECANLHRFTTHEVFVGHGGLSSTFKKMAAGTSTEHDDAAASSERTK